MTNDKGERVRDAGPSVPVEITGLDEVPTGGDIFNAVKDERLARTLAEQRKNDKKKKYSMRVQRLLLTTSLTR